MRRRVVQVAGVLSLALAASSSASGPAPGDPRACSVTPLRFAAPTPLGNGFEPSVDVDGKGTVYVAAAAGGNGASPLWRSEDGGRTFTSMRPLGIASGLLNGLEGDIAVDGKDRLYYFDTWFEDNYVYRYSDRGRTLDYFRPVAPSYEWVDDRPWLAAHHDGVVYYLGNNGGKGARLTIHRSLDGGLTFDPKGFTFPESGWGYVEADPRSDYVYVVMNNLFSVDPSVAPQRSPWDTVSVWVSPDRGTTWRRHVVATYAKPWRNLGSLAWPSLAVSPVDGSVYALWVTDAQSLQLARSTDRGRTWRRHDVSPFRGFFTFPRITAGRDGSVGIVFDGLDYRDRSGSWHLYAMLWRADAGCVRRGPGGATRCTGPASVHGRIGAAFRKPYSQGDYFQGAFAPDGTLHVAYDAVEQGTSPKRVVHVRQTQGPNLTRQGFCGR